MTTRSQVVGLEEAAELQRLRGDLILLERECTRRPLTAVRAWHSDRTSQLAALQSIQDHRTVLIFGGNRSGKTFLLRCVLMALILGSDHPDAAAFWRHNQCDPAAFPTGPGVGWIVALESNASLEYHRPQMLALAPKWGPPHPESQDGTSIASWNMRSRGEARMEIAVPGYDRAAGLVFKSDRPGPDGMQGAACRAVLHDEESHMHGPATWEEADTRLWDQNGWHLMGNTPIHGRTWVYYRWVENGVGDPSTEAVHYIFPEDNPWTDKRRIQAMKDSDHPMRDAKLYGQFIVRAGRVWPAFGRVSHVLPTFELPHDSVLRIRAVDFGTTNPFALLWIALTKRRIRIPGTDRYIPDGSVVVYREHYRAGKTLAWHVARAEAAEADEERIAITWADPEDAQQLLQLRRDHGWAVQRARKAVIHGLDRVAERLAPHETDGMPRLWVMDQCVNTIREMTGYRYPPSRTEKDPTEKPLARDDHTCDCVRYGVVGLDRLGAAIG